MIAILQIEPKLVALAEELAASGKLEVTTIDGHPAVKLDGRRAQNDWTHAVVEQKKALARAAQAG